MKTPQELKDNPDPAWKLMGDKGFQGLQLDVPSILPAKKPRGGELTPQQHDKNKNIASERVIVENFYGRLQSKFGIMTKRFRLDKDLYPFVFDLCVSLCNFHLEKHPLRN